MAGFPSRRFSFERLIVAKNPSMEKKSLSVKMKHANLVQDGDIQSLIPLCMKCQSTLDVSLDGQLKVKRHKIIHTGHSINQQAEEEMV